MISFLYGQDIYRSRQELKKIIDDYEGFDFFRIDCEDEDALERIRQSINTISMFDQKKLIILENLQEELLDFFKKRDLEKDENIIIVFWVEKPDKRLALFKFLKSKAKVKEFSLLKGSQLRNWIKDYVKEQKGEIDNLAIDKLIEYIGSDLWRMSNEINKLLNYNRTIKNESIELLVKPEIDLNIFNMVDALGHKDKNKALEMFKQYLEKREDENYLLTMFIYQIRNLIKAKSGGKLDMHPFVIQKSREQANNFEWDDLKKIYHQLLTIDFDTKTGRADSKTALELFLAKL
jgi:DNA polymerase-3 subunit delta